MGGSDKVNILLVDDQPARLLTYQTVLAELGQNLVPVRSGPEALQKLMNDEFAVVLHGRQHAGNGRLRGSRS